MSSYSPTSLFHPPEAEPPERRKRPRLDIPLWVVVGSVASLLLGYGICGMAFDGNTDKASDAIVIGMVLFWGGAAGFVVGVIWLLVALVIRWFRDNHA